jgi:hypothetical protein
MTPSLIATPGEFLAEQAKQQAQRVRRSVRPIFQVGLSGELEGFGSCVLLKAEARRFLVTAGHIIDGNVDTPDREASTLYFGPEEVGAIVQFSGRAFRTCGRYDMAIVFETAGILDQLPADRFLSVDSNVLYGSSPSYRCCFVLGYRASRKATNLNGLTLKVRPKPFLYVGKIHEQTPTHLKVQIDYKKVRRGNQKFQTGELNGISGGGVFVFDPSHPNAVPLLLGVVTDHKKSERHLLCTRAALIMEIFHEANAK